MQIQVNELDYCKIQVSCIADGEEISSKRSDVVKAFKSAPVPGFRKGKTTPQVIEYYYKGQISDALKRALQEEAFHQSMFEKQYKPIGSPSFTEAFLEPGKFSCQFVVHTKPEFELQDFKTLEIPEPHQDMTESDICQKIIQEVRTINASRVPFTSEMFLESGDLASVTYDVYLDDTKREDLNLSNQGDVFTVGQSQVSGLDDNLLGMKLNETRDVLIPGSEAIHPDTVGKSVKLVVTLNMALKIVPAAFDDELAKKIGKASLEELNQEVAGRAASIYQNRVGASRANAVKAKLVDSYQFKVPDWMALAEAKFIAQQSKVEWNQLSEEVQVKVVAQAVSNIKLSLILEKIRDEEPDAQLSDTEMMGLVRQYLASVSNSSVDDLIKNMNNTGHLNMLVNRLKDEYTLSFVVKTIKYI